MWMETVKLRRCSCCAVRTNRPILSPKGRRIIFECQTNSGCCGSRSFCGGEPLELSRLAQALEVNEGLMEQILKNLEAQLDERGSGLCLLRLGNRYQLCTRTEFAQSVRQALEIKRNAPLSQAAFEVLAVVAYNQPVTKSFVESGAWRRLLRRSQYAMPKGPFRRKRAAGASGKATSLWHNDGVFTLL